MSQYYCSKSVKAVTVVVALGAFMQYVCRIMCDIVLVLVCVAKFVRVCAARLTYEQKSATDSKPELCHFIVCSFVQQLF